MFSAFTLNPGSIRTVDRVGAQVTLSFSPDTVQAQEITNEDVVFTDL